MASNESIFYLRGLFFSCLLMVGPVAAFADQDILSHLLSQYRTNCSIDDEYAIEASGFYSVRFGPDDSITAHVVNPATLTCGGVNVEMCGSRGCPLKVYVEGETHEMVGWEVTTVRVALQSLLAVRQSGWFCGDDLANSDECWAFWEWSTEEQNLSFIR